MPDLVGGRMVGSVFLGPEWRRILDLIVYRCSEDQYFTEQHADESAYVRILGLDPTSRDSNTTRLKGHWSDKHGGSWLINEAVGLISICAAPSKIGALSYFVSGRIMKHMAKRRMFLQGKLFEFNIWPENGSSEQIYEILRQSLRESAADVGRFRGRVIDLEPLDALGPHIDWAGITSGRL
jgi:hypothetical protein